MVSCENDDVEETRRIENQEEKQNVMVQNCKYEKYEKREDDQHEFVRACDELKTELKKTRMYKMITRLLDWLAEKI